MSREILEKPESTVDSPDPENKSSELRRSLTSKRRCTEASEPSYTKGKPEKHRNIRKHTEKHRKIQKAGKKKNPQKPTDLHTDVTNGHASTS